MASPLPGCNALHSLAEGPCSSQIVRTQWCPSGTNWWWTVVHNSDQAPRHNSWQAFEKLGPSLQSVTTAMKEDNHFMSDLPEMVTHIQRTAQLSAALQLELWLSSALPVALPQTFWVKLRETTHPPGCPQEMELKPTDHNFIISLHFGSLKKINMTKTCSTALPKPLKYNAVPSVTRHPQPPEGLAGLPELNSIREATRFVLCRVRWQK